MAWPAIIAAAGALAQTGLNVSAQNSSNERNWRRQQHVNAQNWSHYLYDNNYNTPLNQVRRLRAAGLNPALMYDGGGSVATSTPPDSAQSSTDVAPVMTGLPTIADALAIERNKAEIEAIRASTQKTKEETKEKEISNEVGRMNANAFKSAYSEGLVHTATKAGFGRIIDDYRGNRYQLFESAWNFAILTGCTISESLTSSDSFFNDTKDENHMSVPDFKFDSKAFSKANALYIGGTDAQIAANRAAKMVAEAQQLQKTKDLNIWKWLNDKAVSDKWYESVPATIGLIGLWISEQRFNLPSFNLSIVRSNKSSILPNKD